jgi:hypothetical protein
MAGNSGALDSDSRQIASVISVLLAELTEMVGCWGWIPTTDRWVMRAMEPPHPTTPDIQAQEKIEIEVGRVAAFCPVLHPVHGQKTDNLYLNTCA